MMFDLHASAALALAVWEGLCLALLWTVFCASVTMTKAVRLAVRLAVWGVGLAALFGLAAPLYGWVPDLVALVMVLALVLLQLVRAHGPRARDLLNVRLQRRLGDRL